MCVYYSCLCVITEIVPPQWTVSFTLMEEWSMSAETSGYCCIGETYNQYKYGLCEKEACGELPRDGRTKRWKCVCNSLDKNAQQKWEWNLFSTEKRDCSPFFCPWVSEHVFVVPPDMLLHSVVMALFLSEHLVFPINGKPFVQSFIQVLIYKGHWHPDMHSDKR